MCDYNNKKWWDKTILVISIALSFLINSVLVTWKYTRLNADDQVKLKQAEVQQSDEYKPLQCKNSGGKPKYNDIDNRYLRCDF